MIELLREAQQAYEFSPNSYTHSLLQAVLRLLQYPGTQITGLLEIMQPAEREVVFEKLAELYCFHCGGPQPCQCWNDE